MTAWVSKAAALINLLQQLSSVKHCDDATKIRDEVVEKIHGIVNGLRDLIAGLEQAKRSKDLDGVINDLRRIRDNLQSNYITLAKAYAKGGDERDRAHNIMLELEYLLKNLERFKA